jgi:hypothetical protein
VPEECFKRHDNGTPVLIKGGERNGLLSLGHQTFKTHFFFLCRRGRGRFLFGWDSSMLRFEGFHDVDHFAVALR